MKKAFVIFSMNIIFGIISYNAMAIDWDKCSDSLRHLEDDADRAKKHAEELNNVTLEKENIKHELNGCTPNSYVDCNSIKNKIYELTLKYNRTEVSHNASIAGIGVSLANVQIDCDYNFNLLNISDNKQENMECFRIISFMQWYNASKSTKQSEKPDKYIMNKACIEKKQHNVNFCNKCFQIP